MVAKRVRVGEVLRLERIPVEPDPTTEYVTIGARSFGRGLFHYEPKIGQQLGSLRFFAVQPDRLVISNIKGWEGAIAVSGANDHGCLASNRFLSYAPVDDRIDVGWARWFFLSEQGLPLIQRASPGSADRNRTLSMARFEKLEIPLPPIEKQRHAASRLDRSSSRIRVISGQSATTRAAVALILGGWLGSAIGRFDERRKLAEIAVVTRGRSPRYEAGTDLLAVNQACIRWDGLDLTGARQVEREWWSAVPETGRVRAGDVLVNSTGEGTIGRVTLADDTAYGIPFDSHILVVRCDKSILLPEFLAIYLRSRDGQTQVNQAKGANTTKQTELGKTKLERFMVPVPSLKMQALLVSGFRKVQKRASLIEGLLDEQAVRISAVVPAVLNESFAEFA